MLRNPAGNSLPYPHREFVQYFGMRILGGAQYEFLTLQNEDEAGIAAHMVRNKIHNLVEDLVKRIRRSDTCS
jgi:hypothetical protein